MYTFISSRKLAFSMCWEFTIVRDAKTIDLHLVCVKLSLL